MLDSAYQTLVIQGELARALKEMVSIVGIAFLASLLLGVALGLLLYMTESPIFTKNKGLNRIAGFVINVIRSIPFVILLVLMIPVTTKLVGTAIGPIGASVPLAVAATVFFARLVEGNFREIDKGVLEAAKATGASNGLIVREVLFVEAFPGLVRSATVNLVSIIGFSAMAGFVGGGGLGDLAIRYGYMRYDTGVMLVTVALLVVLVQGVQSVGDALAKKVTRR